MIKKCEKCGKYSLKKSCCGVKTKDPHPLKFSIDDKYTKYRR